VSAVPIATILTAVLVLVIALVGGVETILNPQVLGFESYVKALSAAAVASGVLGLGRGTHAAGQALADAHREAAVGELAPGPGKADDFAEPQEPPA
jgi:hypothetical protein